MKELIEKYLESQARIQERINFYTAELKADGLTLETKKMMNTEIRILSAELAQVNDFLIDLNRINNH